MKKKKALIVSGGGMECSYSAGAVYKLVKKGFLKDLDIIIGGSGCVGTLSYLCAGQYN
jgi:predicted patatin/cPLA2 family phospholipase